ncbi:hypothetical protein SCLCIDRAFT_134965 [Scleroderma citrinum Foug A]|uniref:DDE Tnp4 domain-containing protein n=1 Tax=Scleroderma citrinum Foug A TaxID=1036808 RepID=A0A0C2ZRT8_9AGAM|nr:hypothetical protein SCLCIDRAFT_134965 [Scleroderma citrinum Foug A]
MSQDLANLIPPLHWIWADSTYPCETWCAIPFKKLHRESLIPWKVHVRVEHAFVALKGYFQLLHELQLRLNKEVDLHVVVYWIMSCMILHNMIVHFEDK